MNTYSSIKDYSFFFDESSKADRITLSSEGMLNISDNLMVDSFIGVFSGFETNDLERVRSECLAFENNQKGRFNMNSVSEIKSTFIQKRFFSHGLASLRREHVQFYRDFFELVSTIGPIVFISCVSKMESLVRDVFNDLHCAEHGVIQDKVYYTLTKFLIIYGDDEIFTSFFNVQSRRSEDQLKRMIYKKMTQVIEKSRNIPRMGTVEYAYIIARDELINADVRIRTGDKFYFDYSSSFGVLRALLDEMAVSYQNINLFIDGSVGLYHRAESLFPNTHYVDSIKEPLIRISDHLAGFLNRMIRAISMELDHDEPRLSDFSKDNIDLYSKRMLGVDWFKIDEEIFVLYQRIYRTLISVQPYYWSTLTTAFSDEPIMFYSLLEYFDSYSSYNDYSRVEIDSHPELLNYLTCSNIKSKAFGE